MQLPARLVGAPPATFRMRRLGDAQSDLNSAASALLSDLQSNGCQPSKQADVSAFQNAWNAAWSAGVLGPPMPGPLTIDGFYGANTSQALGAWMTSQGQDGTTVPAGCVGAAPSSGGGGSSSGGGSTTSSTTITKTTTTNNSIIPQSVLSALQNPWMGLPGWLWAITGAVLVGALYETHKRPGVMYARRPRRGRAKARLRRMRRGRRRNPIRVQIADFGSKGYVASIGPSGHKRAWVRGYGRTKAAALADARRKLK